MAARSGSSCRVELTRSNPLKTWPSMVDETESVDTTGLNVAGSPPRLRVRRCSSGGEMVLGSVVHPVSKITASINGSTRAILHRFDTQLGVIEITV